MSFDNPRVTALTNVRVFDGTGMTAPTTVVIDGAVLGGDATGAEIVDAGGAFLLPGFIDAHIHTAGPESLLRLADHGVTTGLDMTTFPPDRVAALRKEPGGSDIRSSGTPVIGPSGPHSKLRGLAGAAVITGPDQAVAVIADRVAGGSDYIKIMLEAPGGGGPDAETATAVVAAAHARGLRVVAHATTVSAYRLALDTGVDVLTHVPLDAIVSPEDATRTAELGRIVIPTLTMMEGIAARVGIPGGLERILATVANLHAAGVPVLAGTDANTEPGVPFHPEHGTSLHHELELLVAAGLTPTQALHAATTLPADHFDLRDRGTITPGARADLILLAANPLTDIRATRTLTRVWCAGVEHPRPATGPS
ncbi:amidohydrolase family protein [Nocardia sp. NPDC057668]|uniref:amidohydrolase family protein n=1 Tax=Nocardia sp. NPDC057668 TaxID=3346202 RepID=UPI003672C318